MKVRLTIDLDIPDSFFLKDEYEEASIHQTVWDETVKQLEVHHLEQQLKAQFLNDEATKTALLEFHSAWYTIFKNCFYKIEKI